jgi:glutaredoxin
MHNAAELTTQIQEQRDRLEKLEARFASDGVEVTRLNQELTQRRGTLKQGDAAAMARFNADVAAYQAKNLSQKALKEQIDLAHQELDRLLTARSQTAAGTKGGVGSARVVMYSTKSCPYCSQAKAYFARKGIPYEDRDIEDSASAREEYKRLGGNGVPLIMVGAERLEGFSEPRLNQMLRL